MSEISDGILEGYRNKLKSKLFGLLREREKNREWEAFLDSILIELMGFTDEDKGIDYYTLFYKLSSARYLDYKYFRKTIFDCMTLVDRMVTVNE